MQQLPQRIARTKDLRAQGYNCAQCVFMAFDDITGLDPATSARLTAALGSGVGGTREICGVVNAMALIEGMTGGDAPTDKVAAMGRAKKVITRFAEANGGCLRCCDLKRPDAPKSCNQLIFEGVEMMHEALKERQSE